MKHKTKADYNTTPITKSEWKEGRSIADALETILHDRRLFAADLHDKGVKVSDIAQSLGVSTAWVYSHVHSYINLKQHENYTLPSRPSQAALRARNRKR